MSRCPRCMSKEYDGAVCPVCDFEKGDPIQIKGIPVGTVVNSRYQIGVAVCKSRQAVFYAAWDQKKQRPVIAEEFFPEQICARTEAGVTPIERSKPRFTAAVQQYLNLKKTPGRSLSLEEAFAINGTAMRIYPGTEGKIPEEAKQLADNPILFRNDKGEVMMSINALKIPPFPAARAPRNMREADSTTGDTASPQQVTDKPVKKTRKKQPVVVALVVVLALAIGVVTGVMLVRKNIITDGKKDSVETEVVVTDTTEEPTAEPIPEQTETVTAEPTDAETPEPTDTQTPEPTDTPTPEPTDTPTPEPTDTPTPEPTDTPTPEPTDTPTPEPTDTPTPEPTDTPTPKPTDTPTPKPTDTPTPEPTDTPTPTPTPIEVILLDGDFEKLAETETMVDGKLAQKVWEALAEEYDIQAKTPDGAYRSILRNYFSIKDEANGDWSDEAAYEMIRRAATAHAILQKIDGESENTQLLRGILLNAEGVFYTLEDGEINENAIIKRIKEALILKESAIAENNKLDNGRNTADGDYDKNFRTALRAWLKDAIGTRVPTKDEYLSIADTILEPVTYDFLTPTPTPAPTDTPTPEPTDTPTPEPTDTPSPKPTDTPTPEPTDTPTPKPTDTPTPEPTDTPTPKPTETPTPEPTDTPIPEPTDTPTPEPADTLSPVPTNESTEALSPASDNASTIVSTSVVTAGQTEIQSVELTAGSTVESTEETTAESTEETTAESTEETTVEPTMEPDPETIAEPEYPKEMEILKEGYQELTKETANIDQAIQVWKALVKLYKLEPGEDIESLSESIKVFMKNNFDIEIPEVSLQDEGKAYDSIIRAATAYRILTENVSADDKYIRGVILNAEGSYYNLSDGIDEEQILQEIKDVLREKKPEVTSEYKDPEDLSEEYDFDLKRVLQFITKTENREGRVPTRVELSGFKPKITINFTTR